MGDRGSHPHEGVGETTVRSTGEKITRSDTFHNNPDIEGCSGLEQFMRSRVEERRGVLRAPIDSGDKLRRACSVTPRSEGGLSEGEHSVT